MAHGVRILERGNENESAAGNVLMPTRPRPSWLPDPTWLARGYAAWRAKGLAAENPVHSQERQLQNLLRRAADTKFGRDHGFAHIKTVADYQRQVPLRRYDDFWQDYWKDSFPVLDNVTWPGRVGYFAVSSGTSTGNLKYIPCTDEMIRSNYRAAKDVLVHHLRNRPKSRVLDGKIFVFGGSTDLTDHGGGIFSGDTSGITGKNRASWAKPFYFPNVGDSNLVEWEDKISSLGPMSLQEKIRGITGGANWIVLFFEHLARMRPDLGETIADFYPDLEVVVHGGVSMAPYKSRFQELLRGSNAELREVYPASEAFMGVADRGSGEGLRLVTDNNVFFEFVPVEDLGRPNPTRHWVGNLETDIDYAIVLTSCSGLWSYVLGDVVRFVDRERPRLLITGRTSYYLSTFGEHVTGELMESTILDVARSLGLDVAEFTVGTEVFDDGRGFGRHVHVIEFRPELISDRQLRQMAVQVDQLLAERNEDYRERRAVGGGIAAPSMLAVAPGAINAWMKSQGKLGGQHKVPRVIGDWSKFKGLLDFVASYEAVRRSEAA